YVVQNYFKMLQYLYRAVKSSQPAADYSSSDEPDDSTMGEEEEGGQGGEQHLPNKRNRRHRHMTMDSRGFVRSEEDGIPLRRASGRFGRAGSGGSSSSSGSNNPFVRAESELKDIPVGMLNNGYYE
ncbi:hypothetical protein FOZ63_022977, partial [Perkinsus olseni]